MHIGFRWLATLAMGAVIVPLAWADYMTIPVNCAGCGTVVSSAATGINNHGDVVGSFINGDGNTYGFYDHLGIFTEVTVPGASYVSPNGINDNGEIVGTYYDGTYHGFLLPAGGPLETVDYGSNARL